jgi:hypothetical protein
MALKIPSNQIKFNYTAGGEYIFKDTYKDYQGYYYETNGKTFAGKEFNQYAPELEKVQIKEGNNRRFNPLLASAATFIYGKVSKFKIDNSKATPFYFVPSEKDVQNGQAYRYFSQQKANNLIKETSEDNYKELTKNPLYNTARIKCYITSDALDPVGNNNYVFDSKELDEAEKKISGIKTWLSV